MSTTVHGAHLFALLGALLCAQTAVAADPGWILQSDDNGIKIYTREKPGTAIREVKAVGVVDAPPHACMNVVEDLSSRIAAIVGTQKEHQ